MERNKTVKAQTRANAHGESVNLTSQQRNIRRALTRIVRINVAPLILSAICKNRFHWA